MSLKRVCSLLMVMLMIVSIATSFVACQKEEVIYELEDILPNQLENGRYYFRQGYKADSWDVSCGEDDRYLITLDTMTDGSKCRYKCGLAVQFTPKGRNDITYSIYNIAGVSGAAVTRGTIFEQLVNEEKESSFHFNELFRDASEENGRDNFVLEKYENVDETTVNINKTQFNKLGYTFTKDGVDWKGTLYFIPHNKGGISSFHLITVETEVSAWDAYAEDIEVMLKDFKQTGYETKQQ